MKDRKHEPIKASQRIARDFLDLLENQFPIKDQQVIFFRSASQFANQLNIHVNHLNRSLKTALDKSTTQVISERIFKEAEFLLLHTTWSVAEISNALGFTETTHFNNFFRKNAKMNPTKFRRR